MQTNRPLRLRASVSTPQQAMEPEAVPTKQSFEKQSSSGEAVSPDTRIQETSEKQSLSSKETAIPDAKIQETPRRHLRSRVIEIQPPEGNKITRPSQRNSQDVPLNGTTPTKGAVWSPEADSGSDSDECVVLESRLDLTEKEPGNVSPAKVNRGQEVQLETEDAKKCDSDLETTETSEKQSLSSKETAIPDAKIQETPRMRLRNRVIEIQPPEDSKITTRSPRKSQDVLYSTTPAKVAVWTPEADSGSESDECVVVESMLDLTEKVPGNVSPAKVNRGQEVQLETEDAKKCDSGLEKAQVTQEPFPKTLRCITPVFLMSEQIAPGKRNSNHSDDCVVVESMLDLTEKEPGNVSPAKVNRGQEVQLETEDAKECDSGLEKAQVTQEPFPKTLTCITPVFLMSEQIAPGKRNRNHSEEPLQTEPELKTEEENEEERKPLEKSEVLIEEIEELYMENEKHVKDVSLKESTPLATGFLPPQELGRLPVKNSNSVGRGQLGTVHSQMDSKVEEHENPVKICKQKVNKKRKKDDDVEEARPQKALKKRKHFTDQTEEKLEEVESEGTEECEKISAKPEHRLIVRNLDPSKTFSELQIALIHFFLKRNLSLTGIKIKKSRKQGHVTFLSQKDLNRAVELDGKLLLGNVLQLCKEQDLEIPAAAVLNEKSKELDTVFREKKKKKKIQEIVVLNEKSEDLNTVVREKKKKKKVQEIVLNEESKELDTVFREQKKKKKIQEIASWCLYMRNLNSKKTSNTLKTRIGLFLSKRQLPFQTVTVDPSRRSACVDLSSEDDLNKVLEFDGFKILGRIVRFSKVEKLGELDQEKDARILYIKNFSATCSPKDLKNLFTNAINVKIKTHPKKSNRFAFVKFKTVKDAKQAFRKIGKEGKGKNIEIKRIFTPVLHKVCSQNPAKKLHTQDEASSQPLAKRKYTQAEDKGFSGGPKIGGNEKSEESDSVLRGKRKIQELVVLSENSKESDTVFREKKKKKIQEIVVLSENSKESDTVFREKKKKKIQEIVVLSENSKESDTVFREKKKKKIQEMAVPVTASCCLYVRNLNLRKTSKELEEAIGNFLSSKKLPFNTVTVNPSRRSACVDLPSEDDLIKALEFDGFKILKSIARFSKVEKLGELDQEDDSRILHVRNFPATLSPKDLQNVFTNAIDVQIKTHPKKSKRFAFVRFKTRKDADRAFRRDEMEMEGNIIKIERTFWKDSEECSGKKIHTHAEDSTQIPAKVTNPTNSLFIRGLRHKTKIETLMSIFEGAVSAMIPRGDQAVQFGFVHFETAEEAEEAMTKMQNKKIDGRKVEIYFATCPRGKGGKHRSFNRNMVANGAQRVTDEIERDQKEDIQYTEGI
ncbi:titin homolog isoform X3 [Callorhinchus milii]|uniref:titin homolog isoform X3 n=1 Tax=Callorhinchus milii TaxID=7868 RepID=UPI001C3FDC7E|nr:titin homolog isoform X3 [Callorhinchus milii]